MGLQRYGEFSAQLHQRLMGKRIPVSGTIEVSRRCPLNCEHCYNNLPMDDRQAQKNELSYQEYCRILNEIAEAGCFWLLFTGGEIFARRDFLDIYTYAKTRGFLITLFTNGTMITPKIADYLAEWRPFSIEITLYGRTKETYEKLTRVPGSYEKCLRGIGLLKERGLPVKLKTVAVRTNKHEVFEMKQFAEELGLEFKFDSMVNPRIDCSRSPLNVRLLPEEVVELDLRDPRRVAEYQKFAARFNGPVNPPERSDEVYHCGGGMNSFAIDPLGKLSICVLSHFDTYDLRAGSFAEGWQEFLMKVRRGKKITMMTKCLNCEIKAICGMCPANGELESGHPEKPVDFLCKTAHLRANLFGYAPKPHGECEYCPSGVKHNELMNAIAALKKKEFSISIGETAAAAAPEATGCGGGCYSCSVA